MCIMYVCSSNCIRCRQPESQPKRVDRLIHFSSVTNHAYGRPLSIVSLCVPTAMMLQYSCFVLKLELLQEPARQVVRKREELVNVLPLRTKEHGNPHMVLSMPLDGFDTRFHVRRTCPPTNIVVKIVCVKSNPARKN